MFHKVKTVTPLPDHMLLVYFVDGTAKQYDVKQLFDKHDSFSALKSIPELFRYVSVDTGGYGVSWNDEIDISCDELWENGAVIVSPFDNLIAFSDATDMWGLNESTLRKAVSYGKLINGIDVKKFGKQWIVTKDAMIREYGQPTQEDV